MNLENCPNCGNLFVKSQFRDICESCYKEEEKQFEKVYQFLRKRENRMATMTQVVNGTGVKESLLIKFIRNGRLKLAPFPNLGYPCDRCGKMIREGKLCANCLKDLNQQIEKLQKEEMKKKRQASTVYYVKKEENDSL
ncbi:TIGR03826 family flagellar region protein [Thermaerobacillus caldiproteolyticus]|uniref:Flagellar operon protein (TIGR03826 family) n=1 Tax=Thermaerobacillus caldiproteolyticus TaxID=247480 RepID=A0A7V9Z644_9BACL|nr:TIGR03826 family flagellar region protein [Anoxybacillus caldiproteolyticus]MBA2874618.1 flagellar operon protein (TIGR03826 family) [Anoxybacillus caldiproteolyticus]